MAQVAHEIWEHPELGYLETRASKLLQDELAAAGFEVQAGIAGMPTAFVASAGNGKGPVIALLAEMDALPGMSQAALPEHARSEEHTSELQSLMRISYDVFC